MTNTADRNLIVGLDIGTTKVAVLVGEVLPDGELNVIGMGSHASRGMEKGGVNDLDSVVKSLRRAVEEAEMMADCRSVPSIWGCPASTSIAATRPAWCPSPTKR